MVEKKDGAPVDDVEDDDIDIDLDYLLEEGLEAAEKEKKPAKKAPAKSAKSPQPKKKKAVAEKKEDEKPAAKAEAPTAPAKKEAKPAKAKQVKKAEEKKSSEAPAKKTTDKKDDKPSPKKKETAKKEKKSAPKKAEEKPKEEVLVVEDEEEEGAYVAKLKPALPDDVQAALRERAYRKKRMPHFRRQEWFRYKRLGTSWRRPRGLQSKMRRHFKYRPNVVSIGYGTNRLARNLHPSGFEEVLVYRPLDLEGMDPTLQAARIGHSVGSRKREMIEKRAKELGIRVLNRSG